MFYNLHSHSQYSVLDALPTVEQMVDKVVALGQPALGLTDHGNMSGAVQLYKACKARNIAPFIGQEFYLVDYVSNKDAKRYHILIHALNFDGYQELVKLSSIAHQREYYHYKPRIDYEELEEADTSNLIATTGCYFGPVIQELVHDSEEAATKAIKKLAKIFNKDNLFIEIQQHNHAPEDYPSEREIALALYEIALRLGIPTLITNDAHYCKKNEKHLHDFMKSIAYKAADPGDVTFPGDSYHLASEAWISSHYFDDLWPIWEDSQESFKALLKRNKLSIPTLDNYKYFIPKVADNSFKSLKKACIKWVKNKPADYKERMNYELSVISTLGMADYFLLVKEEITDFCRDNDIMFNTRGSANGSLVCYALGITNVDPIVWELTFDRFISLDRTRPPDIDLDIQDNRRGEVIDHLAGKYNICQIGTYGRMGYQEDGSGGVFVQFLASERHRLGNNFEQVWGKPKSLFDIEKVNPHAAEMLRELGDRHVLKSAGAHAAGFILSTKDHSIYNLIPTMLIASSGTTVTQYLMDDVEDFGFVKIDTLGSRALTTIGECLRLINQTPEFLNQIQLDDEKVFRLLRQGRTNTGIFQFEGYTQADGCRKLKVKSIEDLIRVNALYRPAITNNGYDQLYLSRRDGVEPVDYIDDAFEEVLDPTFGIPVFQEQVMEILRIIGFDVTELNAMLKALKASNDRVIMAEATFAKLKEQFYHNCSVIGLDSFASNQAWEMVRDFSSYAFNRAHAVSYGLIGYYMAYLKIHYPLEFHAALLITTLGTPKEKQYELEAKRNGISILTPDVNISDTNWVIDYNQQAIRRGLVSIKGVGEKAAQQIIDNRPFEDLSDLIQRTDSRAITGGKLWEEKQELNGVLLKLQNAGALRSLGIARV